MKGIPPEIDDLMWRLAEEGGPVAQAEFEARHARYGPELSRRIRMVAELRQAGKAVAHRPKFTPRPVRAATPRWMIGAAVGLSVLAVGAVAYVAASADERTVAPKSTRTPAPKVEPVPVVKQEPVVKPPPAVVQSPPEQKPTPPKVAEADKPRDIKIADVSLTDAIRLVAASAGLKVTVAPGFPEQTVSLDYPGLSAMDILKAMGDQYGFSVLEEEEGAILVIPARPEPDRRRIGP